MTPWAGTKNYQLELLYYGAYVPNYKHFVIGLFIQPTSLINIHLPNAEQNAFESFHFVSSRLNIVELEALYTCNTGQVLCYDGPGFKSPFLQFTYNQSIWECLSSTFQMMCKFSRVNKVCTNGTRLHYRAIRARDDQVNVHITTVTHSTLLWRGFKLTIDESESKGTSNYIFYHPDFRGKGDLLEIKKMDISFPYMLSEGNSCMYGGLYIVQNILSSDSEILSLCTSILNGDSLITRLNNVFCNNYSL